MIISGKIIAIDKHVIYNDIYIYAIRIKYSKPLIQICSNISNKYEVGDIVAVAKVGHKFDDDFFVNSELIGNTLSQGLILGKTNKKLPGIEL